VDSPALAPLLLHPISPTMLIKTLELSRGWLRTERLKGKKRKKSKSKEAGEGCTFFS
jgi:hypothetical protein